MLSYDPNLRKRIPGCDTESGMVLNSRFSHWEEYIFENSKDRQTEKTPAEKRYETEGDQPLVAACLAHAEEYNGPSTKRNAIIIVHPLYLSLSHNHLAKTDQHRLEVDEYLDLMFGFLNYGRDKASTSIALLDTIYHYAAATSLLLENGLVDNVVFTETGGHVLHKGDLKQYSGKKLFFAGGYNERCLNNAVRDMINATKDNRNIYAIYDLVLNSPSDSFSSLTTRTVSPLARDKAISLDELTGKLEVALAKPISKRKQFTGLEKARQYFHSMQEEPQASQ